MKTKTGFACAECGHAAPRWLGQCPRCGTWNSMKEETVIPSRSETRATGGRRPRVSRVALGDIDIERLPRYTTGIREFDRVLGGGLVPGSVVLVAGDPGVGKSTLLLEAASAYAGIGLEVLYVSGEESARQLRLRSQRLGNIDPKIQVLASTRIEDVEPALGSDAVDLVIVDSVQTLQHPDAAGAAGSTGQVRDNTLYFMEFAKGRQIPVLLVGHVTKEGTVAGPRVVEHLVDAVLYLEGDRYHHYRVLRAAKNRFGPTHEVGLFEMGETGLREVKNPSAFLLEERRPGTSGSAVVAAMEGTRPLLLEVQALVGGSGLASPRRTAVGIHPKRLAVMLAVLERRAGIHLSGSDVFVNVAGGMRVDEPGVDLALALAVASAQSGVPLDPDTVVMGEVGLGGEVRRVGQLPLRVNEASKLGFRTAVVPSRGLGDPGDVGLELVPVERVDEALDRVLELRPRAVVEGADR